MTPPPTLVSNCLMGSMLNDYFTAVGKAISEERGTVDKYGQAGGDNTRSLQLHRHHFIVVRWAVLQFLGGA